MFNNAYISKRKTNNTPIVTLFKECTPENDGVIFTHMHYHDDFEILYIRSGKVKMIINGESIIAEDNSVVIINPYETHYGELLSESLSYYCIDFDYKFLGLSNTDEIISNSMKYINYIHDASELKNYICAVHNSYMNEKKSWDIYAKANLLLIFYYLHDKIIKCSASKADFGKSVINYIEAEFMNNISSKDASFSLKYNHNYFCRAFKKNFGCTFSSYLNEYRIRLAQKLLTSYKVTEVSAMVGFSNITYFSVMFKKITGISPSDYRKIFINHL